MSTPVKLPAEVEKIIRHAEGVKSFFLRPLRHCPNFKPGQFLHLAIDEYDPSFHWPESRVFSIANSPTRRERTLVTFSVKGKFTQRMFNEVRKGDIVWLKLPYGNFLFPDNDAKDIVLIAGGTGITPFVSFLEYAIDNQVDTKISLYYGVQSPQYLIFDSLIQECDKALRNFNYHIFVERNANVKMCGNISNGMLPVHKILAGTDENSGAVYYLSGPRQMILNFREKLIGNSIPESNIMVDEWE